MTFTAGFVEEAVAVLRGIDQSAVEACATGLADIRHRGGRLFILGVGGSAGHASHAVNDFRKLCDVEAYTPTDNVSELTARINDEGWETAFGEWLRGCLDQRDGLLVLSVGGGDRTRACPRTWWWRWSSLVRAASIFAIVGRDGGFAAEVADACVVIPPLFPQHVTPHTEGLCAVIWHLLVSHPARREARRSGRPSSELPGTASAIPGVHRRRGGLHREPLCRPSSGRGLHRAGHRVRQLLIGTGVARRPTRR